MKHIHRFDPESEFYTEERCHIIELYNTDDDRECSIARCRIEPGITTQLHSLLDTVERYVILEGEGVMVVGNEKEETVRPMDVIDIPSGTPQQITNTGKSDLIFLAVCTPRFVPDCYVNLEE